MPQELLEKLRRRGLARDVEEGKSGRIDEVVVGPVVEVGKRLVERGGNVAEEDREVPLDQSGVLCDVIVHGSPELLEPPVPERLGLPRFFHIVLVES